ncbi:MAG: ABC transporter permease [Chloroflexi bacterium]|nr:ABC transporter permease [Chloroflexota bacterium]
MAGRRTLHIGAEHGGIPLSEILRNMVRRKTRTALTVFGIAIGVFALTVMGAMVEYFNVMMDRAERLVTNSVGIQPASRSADDRLDSTTLQALRRVDGVQDVSNTIGGLLTDDDINVSFGPPDQVLGIAPHHIPEAFRGVTLQAGRWLDESDTRAAVIGATIARKRRLGVGSMLTWRKNDYVVGGVMKDTNTFPDGMALMPFDTVRRA